MGNYFSFKKISIFILPIILIMSLICIIPSQTITVWADSNDSQKKIQKFEPSPAPVRGIGFWIYGGFKLQPRKDYYVTAGDSFEIDTESTRSLFSTITNPFEPLRHQWYETQDDIHWKLLSVDHEDLTVKTEQAGTRHYQLFDRYSGIFTVDDFYSEVATVHVLPEVVPVESLEMDVDADYLYNSDNKLVTSSAYAKAKPYPENTTENVKWSTSDATLATVDHIGKIQANYQGKSGDVIITGKITNPDGTSATSEKKITIGSGLDDQTVDAKKRATFEIRSSSIADKENNSSNYTVDWYKVDKNHPSGQHLKKVYNSLSYTTDVLSEKNNNDKYYAQIRVKSNMYRTNNATLTVRPSLDPKVEIKGIIRNKTFHDGKNTDASLQNVTTGDHITHEVHLNNSGKQNLVDADLTIYLTLHTQIDTIKINGKEFSDYAVATDILKNYQVVKLKMGHFKINDRKTVKLDTVTQEIKEGSDFSAKPVFKGTYDDNHYESIGNDLKMNYVTNKLTTHFKDIQFEPITAFERNVVKYRASETDEPSEVIAIDDQRRNRKRLKIFVKQAYGLTNLSNKSVLNADLMFHDDGPMPKAIINKVLVAQSADDEVMESVHWGKKDGLLLHVNNANTPAGKYETTLNWNIEDTV